jgi:hypothetical protein
MQHKIVVCFSTKFVKLIISLINVKAHDKNLQLNPKP